MCEYLVLMPSICCVIQTLPLPNTTFCLHSKNQNKDGRQKLYLAAIFVWNKFVFWCIIVLKVLLFGTNWAYILIVKKYIKLQRWFKMFLS